MVDERNEKPLSTADMVEATRREEKVPEPVEIPGKAAEAQSVPLLNREAEEELRSRWNSIQTKFVDDPRSAVEQADSLVAEVMKRIAEMFSEERAALEHQWTQGDNVSTEDLRVALQRYRSFFNRLLSL